MPNRAEEKWGLLQIYCGDGKGKTTAALGAAVRALGAGKRVGIVFFDKGGDHYSERAAFENFVKDGRLQIAATGLDRIDPVTGRFRFGVTAEDCAEARRGLAAAREMFRGDFDLVILDEFVNSLRLGMVSEAEARGLLDERPKNVECVCTGREPPDWLKEKADLVTEMKMVKHYFYQGVVARQGMDY